MRENKEKFDMILSEVENYAIKYYRDYRDDPKIWENHVRLVRKYALVLADLENADKQVVEIAAVLHDIGKDKDRSDHNVRGCELSKELLKKIVLDNHKKELILKCILKHSSKFSIEENEIEVKVLQSADALGTLFDEDWQEFSRKTNSKENLLALYDKSLRKINLESAKEIAMPQIEKLKKLLQKN